NNAWMLEAGGGFCFATESLKMCFRRPVTKAYDFERHCAVETFLPRAINHALTAATDFFEQFVIAECCLHPYGARSHFPRARRSRPTCIRRLVDFIYEQAKTRLQKTGRTRTFSQTLSSALAANCSYTRHFGSVDCSPFRYCNKFRHRLLPQYP